MPGLNLSLHNNNTYLLINVVPFRVVSLWIYTASPGIMSPCQAFLEVWCLKLSNCMPWRCLNYVMALSLVLLRPSWVLGKENHFVFGHIFTHRQSRAIRFVVIVEKPFFWVSFLGSVCCTFCTDTVIYLCCVVSSQFLLVVQICNAQVLKCYKKQLAWSH